MSQTTEDQTTTAALPTSEEVIGKVNESITALQTAQQTVVEGANLLGEHVNDPNAHGAAVPEVVMREMPQPIWNGTNLTFQKADGTQIVAPVNLKGEPGTPGPVGPRPEHQWSGTELKIQNADGSWPGTGINLKGEPGEVANLSDAVDSDSSSTAASSRAVKTAHDKAVAAQSAATTAKTTAEQALEAAAGGATGDITGNAATATRLKAARTITLSGAVTGSAEFDGSKNIILSTSVRAPEIDDPDYIPRQRVYTTVGENSFLVPSGITKILVLCIGGGAYGVTGYGEKTPNRSKGGLGAMAASAYVDVTPGQNIPIVVAGAAGTSSFGSYVSCNTAYAGSITPVMTSQAGSGSSGIGHPNVGQGNLGGRGGKGFNFSDWHVFATTGGAATNSGTEVSSDNGAPGVLYGGGGGGGAYDSNDNSGFPGGSGAQGIVVVFW